MNDPDSAAELERIIERYNEAWNAQDLDAIMAFHAPGMVFENHTVGERAEGADVRAHNEKIFASWPDLSFRGRRLYVRDGLVVSEWTATATASDGRVLESVGIDVFPFENGQILRKDVYSAGHRPRVLSRVDASAFVPRPRVHVTAPVLDEVTAALTESFELVHAPEGADGVLSLLTTDRRRWRSSTASGRSSGSSPTMRSASTTSTSGRRAERGVVVANTPDVLTRTTAELAVGLMLALLRRDRGGGKGSCGGGRGVGVLPRVHARVEPRRQAGVGSSAPAASVARRHGFAEAVRRDRVVRVAGRRPSRAARRERTLMTSTCRSPTARDI